MMYVKSSGAITQAVPAFVDDLLSKTNHTEIEDSLTTLGYQPAVHIGREHAAELEIHINSNRDANPAAIAFVSLGDYYEAYIIESRHAALMFAKEYSEVIKNICKLQYKDSDD
ncbi:hypothetical protein C1882_21870 [Pseudomonas sp. FW305-E2]|jgi:hypothetical protein|uniref:hypothetical protein n=1 Tax=Pseudomonas sp. FW305-E2 TaxID=2075558 RepID=UPI000B4EDDA6|nr:MULTISPECIES: hypothetical protein [Pseudomonas]POA82533.1 hypothetical protein C1882_21870 [Pseudomonas sp. FW305-E2]